MMTSLSSAILSFEKLISNTLSFLGESFLSFMQASSGGGGGSLKDVFDTSGGHLYKMICDFLYSPFILVLVTFSLLVVLVWGYMVAEDRESKSKIIAIVIALAIVYALPQIISAIPTIFGAQVAALSCR